MTSIENGPATAEVTVALVHGILSDTTTWSAVADRLRSAGVRVVVVENRRRGLEEDAEDLRAVLEQLDAPVIVAGHSYGGSVMSQAVETGRSVRGLVFIAAVGLQPGESISDLAGSGIVGLLDAPSMKGAAIETPLEQKATRAGWRSIPSWALVPLRDHVVTADAIRSAAARAGAHIEEIDASHDVVATHPYDVADFILWAARESSD